MSFDTQLGAHASQAQLMRVLGYIGHGRAEGARLLTGGGQATVDGLENGFFMQPTLFTDVNIRMRIAQEEIFGPVTSILIWDDEEEMLRMANDSVYGLGGGVWTQNLVRVHRIAGALETGTVWVNQYYNFIGACRSVATSRAASVESLPIRYSITTR